MWSIGIANACEVLIPSLGLDEKHFAAAASSASNSKGLSRKKLDKVTDFNYADKKIMSGLKRPAPFSVAQLKEIGVSLAKNCGR
jgi:hypothetical protein